MSDELTWAEKKAIWVEALRSGEYAQGVGYLCKANRDGSNARFCCLGVYADLFIEAEWEYDYNRTWVFRTKNGYGASSFLVGDTPPEMMHFANRLAAMNDDGHSFDEIADFIEENL